MRAWAVGALALALALGCGKKQEPALWVRVAPVGGGILAPAASDEVLAVLSRRGEALGAVEVLREPDGSFRIGLPAGIPDTGMVAGALVQRDAFAMWLVDDGASASIGALGTLAEARAGLPGRAVVENTSGYGERWFVLAPPPVVTDADVVSAEASVDRNTGSSRVTVTFEAGAARRFGDVTAANVGKRLAIVQSGACVSAPVVLEAIRGGSASVDMGAGSPEEGRREAEVLAAVLGGGALPVPLEVLEVSVGP